MLSPSFCFVPRPPRGINHPADRPTVRLLPARDYCPSTRNQLTGHPVRASVSFCRSLSLFLSFPLSICRSDCLFFFRRLFLRDPPQTPRRRLTRFLARLRSLFLFFFFLLFLCLSLSREIARTCVSAIHVAPFVGRRGPCSKRWHPRLTTMGDNRGYCYRWSKLIARFLRKSSNNGD